MFDPNVAKHIKKELGGSAFSSQNSISDNNRSSKKKDKNNCDSDGSELNVNFNFTVNLKKKKTKKNHNVFSGTETDISHIEPEINNSQGSSFSWLNSQNVKTELDHLESNRSTETQDFSKHKSKKRKYTDFSQEPFSNNSLNFLKPKKKKQKATIDLTNASFSSNFNSEEIIQTESDLFELSPKNKKYKKKKIISRYEPIDLTTESLNTSLESEKSTKTEEDSTEHIRKKKKKKTHSLDNSFSNSAQNILDNDTVISQDPDNNRIHLNDSILKLTQDTPTEENDSIFIKNKKNKSYLEDNCIDLLGGTNVGEPLNKKKKKKHLGILNLNHEDAITVEPNLDEELDISNSKKKKHRNTLSVNREQGGSDVLYSTTKKNKLGRSISSKVKSELESIEDAVEISNISSSHENSFYNNYDLTQSSKSTKEKNEAVSSKDCSYISSLHEASFSNDDATQIGKKKKKKKMADICIEVDENESNIVNLLPKKYKKSSKKDLDMPEDYISSSQASFSTDDLTQISKKKKMKKKSKASEEIEEPKSNSTELFSKKDKNKSPKKEKVIDTPEDCSYISSYSHASLGNDDLLQISKKKKKKKINDTSKEIDHEESNSVVLISKIDKRSTKEKEIETSTADCSYISSLHEGSLNNDDLIQISKKKKNKSMTETCEEIGEQESNSIDLVSRKDRNKSKKINKDLKEPINSSCMSSSHEASISNDDLTQRSKRKKKKNKTETSEEIDEQQSNGVVLVSTKDKNKSKKIKKELDEPMYGSYMSLSPDDLTQIHKKKNKIESSEEIDEQENNSVDIVSRKDRNKSKTIKKELEGSYMSSTNEASFSNDDLTQVPKKKKKKNMIESCEEILEQENNSIDLASEKEQNNIEIMLKKELTDCSFISTPQEASFSNDDLTQVPKKKKRKNKIESCEEILEQESNSIDLASEKEQNNIEIMLNKELEDCSYNITSSHEASFSKDGVTHISKKKETSTDGCKDLHNDEPEKDDTELSPNGKKKKREEVYEVHENTSLAKGSKLLDNDPEKYNDGLISEKDKNNRQKAVKDELDLSQDYSSISSPLKNKENRDDVYKELDDMSSNDEKNYDGLGITTELELLEDYMESTSCSFADAFSDCQFSPISKRKDDNQKQKNDVFKELCDISIDNKSLENNQKTNSLGLITKQSKNQHMNDTSSSNEADCSDYEDILKNNSKNKKEKSRKNNIHLTESLASDPIQNTSIIENNSPKLNTKKAKQDTNNKDLEENIKEAKKKRNDVGNQNNSDFEDSNKEWEETDSDDEYSRLFEQNKRKPVGAYDYCFTDNDKKILKGLSITIDFDVPAIHQISSRCTRPTQAEVKAMKENGIYYKKGKFSKEEDDILRSNWKNFVKTYDIEDKPCLFFTFKTNNWILPSDIRVGFLLCLAKNLDNRTLFQVYQRFKVIFRSSFLKSGRFTAEEDRTIVHYLKTTKSNTAINDLAKMLNRTPAAIDKRCNHLIKCNDIKSINWTTKKIQIFIQTLLRVTKCESVKQLRDRRISSKEWTKLSKKLDGIPRQRLQDVWERNIYSKLFIKKKHLDMKKVKLNVIRRMYENKENDWKTLNWEKYTSEYPGLTVAKLYSVIKTLVHHHVKKKEDRDNLKESLACLYEKFLWKGEHINKYYLKKIVFDDEYGVVCEVK